MATTAVTGDRAGNAAITEAERVQREQDQNIEKGLTLLKEMGGSLMTPAVKISIVVGILLSLGMVLGFASAAGKLTPNVGALGGVGLIGFTLPMTILGAILSLYLLKRALPKELTANTTKEMVTPENRAKLDRINKISSIGCLALMFGALYISSQLICTQFSTLPKISYVDALKVMGHMVWMSIVATLAIILLCIPCVLRMQRALEREVAIGVAAAQA